mgnify:FL=1
MWLILWEVAGDVSRYIVQMMPCVLAGAVLFFILRPVRLRRLASKGLESPPLREMGIFLFMLFCAGMAALTVFPSNLWSYVLSPGRWPEGTTFWSFYPTITEVSVWLESLPEDLPQLLTPFPMGISYHFRSYWRVFLFLGNIGMFLPIGFFPVLLWRQGNLRRSTIVGILTSLAIETSQLFIDRGTDLDDLILNTVGAITGYFLYRLLRVAAPGFTAKFTCVKV